MTAIYQKPENALKRAEQLISVNEHAEALNVLHSTLSHRRLRVNGWDSNVELIMSKFIRLCVDLGKLKHVREGLHSYRTLTQQHNVLSLLKVMKELRDLSEKKLDGVKAQASTETALPPGVDDLEADESPESLMLSTLQVEVRDKTAKELYAALLGCWETYKIIMDLLRFTPKIDYFYHDTACRALDFCLVNKRPQEFRRLCDTLRMHYVNFQKYRSRPDFETFLRPESHIPTRLAQMDTAAELGLWSQCFQTAEDILSLGLHDLLQRSLNSRETMYYKNRSTLLSQMSRFYEKLAQIFKVSGQWTFHASAVLRNLFHTRQHKRSVTKEEQIQLCNVAVISVLCVPVLQKSNQGPVELEYHKKLSSMLGQGCTTTRTAMQSIIETRGILAAASPEIQSLYNHIEGDVDPMMFCIRAEELLSFIKENDKLHEAYTAALKRVVFDRLILKLGTIYTSLSIDFFVSSVCPDFFLPWREAEAMIVQLVHDGFTQLRFDYSRRALFFGDALDASDTSVDNRFSAVANVLEDIVLEGTLSNIFPTLLETEKKHHDFYSHFSVKLQAEAERLRQRNQAVADQRVRQEKERCAKEEARKTKEREKQRLEEQEERDRREAALRHHEILRRREAQEQLMHLYAEQIVAEFQSIAEKTNGKITHKGKPIEEITVEDILSVKYDYEDYEYIQEELRNREKQERSRQHRQESKRMDYVVRALREEESHLIKEWKEKMNEQDAHDMSALLVELVQTHKTWMEERSKRRSIFLPLKHHKDEFSQTRLEERRKAWKALCEERLKRIKNILREQKLNRARERRTEYEDARLREEALEKERFEAEALEMRELKLKQEAEEEEERRQRAFEKQREKEQEVERRYKAREEMLHSHLKKSFTAEELDWTRPAQPKAVPEKPTLSDEQDTVVTSTPSAPPKSDKYVPPQLRNASRVAMMSKPTSAPSTDLNAPNKRFPQRSRFPDMSTTSRRYNQPGSSSRFNSGQNVEIIRNLGPRSLNEPLLQSGDAIDKLTRYLGGPVDDGFTTVTKKVKARLPK